MTIRAQRIWREIVADYPPAHFRPAEYPLLRAYCEAEALHFEACLKVAEEGGVIDRLGLTKEGELVRLGVKANPWVAIMVSQAGIKAQMATKLKLSQSTKRAGDEEPEKPKSKRGNLLALNRKK